MLKEYMNSQMVYRLDGNRKEFHTMVELINHWPDRFKFPYNPIVVSQSLKRSLKT